MGFVLQEKRAEDAARKPDFAATRLMIVGSSNGGPTLTGGNREGRKGSVRAIIPDGTIGGTDTMNDDFSRQLGDKLRIARLNHGLTLAQVEERSGGRWTSERLGHYECG